jgi:protein-S-isoprenylcysteine O-methyltransferase Ste14
MNLRPVLARAFYGMAFAALLPAVMLVWARSLAVGLPPCQAFWPGMAVLLAGGLLWIGGTLQLMVQGGGLPMNAFPPPRLVQTGLYAAMGHPIYAGFIAGCAGLSLIYGSAAGLWVVTPLSALGCLALLVGYERMDLERRFGPAALAGPLQRLPPAGEEAVSAREGVAVWLLVLVPWLLAYEAVLFLGQPPDAIDVRMSFERSWPVWEWTELVYATSYLVVPLSVFLAPSRSRLRNFALQGLLATSVVTLIYLCVPFIAPHRSFEPRSLPGRLLALEHIWSLPPVATWPAFHVLWACFAAEMLAARSAGWRLLWWGWALAVSLSCLTTGMHAAVDVAAAFVFYFVFKSPERLWRGTLAASERIANSWRSYRFGPIRVMNHAIYPGAAAGLGLLGMTVLAGPASLPGLLLIALGSLIGAALWAQLVEGSPSLLRPFGYYGSILGGGLGALVAGLLGQPVWLILGAAAAMAPWIQAVGRLRCLVQGCCHGRPSLEGWGIRVWSDHSRAVRLAGLKNVPIHATQLYSILGNVVIGSVLLRIWFLHTPLSLVAGLYLILAGLARFMEEPYRGEPQTRMLLGLPIYQHLAAASVAAGMILTMVPAGHAPAPASLGVKPFLAALAVGAIHWFAMGVDFPESSRRFSRLSG